MGLLDQFKKGGAQVVRAGAVKVEISKRYAKIGELYAELGESAFQLYRKNQLRHAELQPFFDHIERLLKEIDQLKVEGAGVFDTEEVNAEPGEQTASRLDQVKQSDTDLFGEPR